MSVKVQTLVIANKTRIILQHTGSTFNCRAVHQIGEWRDTRYSTVPLVWARILFWSRKVVLSQTLIIFADLHCFIWFLVALQLYLIHRRTLGLQHRNTCCTVRVYVQNTAVWACPLMTFHIISCPLLSAIPLICQKCQARVSGTWGSKCNGPLSRNVTWVLQPATTGKTVFGVGNRTGCKLQGEGFGPFICCLGLW